MCSAETMRDKIMPKLFPDMLRRAQAARGAGTTSAAATSAPLQKPALPTSFDGMVGLYGQLLRRNRARSAQYGTSAGGGMNG